MPEQLVRRRRRRAPTPRAPALKAWWSKAAVGLTPAFLYAVHLTAGANQMIAAQGFSLILALILCAALTRPWAVGQFADLKGLWPILALFSAVMLIAAWTQIAPGPDDPASVWRLVGARGALTVNRSATWLEMVKLLGLACVFALGCLHGARRDRARATVEWVVLLGGVYAAFSIIIFLAGFQVRGRLSGGFLSANSGATVFGLLAVITTGLLIQQLRRTAQLPREIRIRRLAAPGGSLFLILVCLALTASRMGLTATGIGLFCLLAWEFASRRAHRFGMRAGGVALLVAGLALVAAAAAPLLGRFGQIQSDSSVRGLIFSTHWKAFLDAPLFGHGLGAFSDINNQLMTQDNYAALWSIRAAHNVYIQWLEEAGVIGALPMFALIATLIVMTVRRILRMKAGRTLLRGLAASNLVILLHGTTDYALQVPSIAAFWAFLLGLQFAFAQSGEEKPDNSRASPSAKM
jgi:O-antigen ligase